jgi:hypothetical protein
MTATTNKAKEVSIDRLWESAPISEQTFNPTSLTHLPEITRRYLEHAIALERVKFLRWGNPDGGEHHYVDFGGVVEAEQTFGDYTIPTQLRLGWFFDSERFESEGEFFRCTIDNAIYR